MASKKTEVTKPAQRTIILNEGDCVLVNGLKYKVQAGTLVSTMKYRVVLDFDPDKLTSFLGEGNLDFSPESCSSVYTVDALFEEIDRWGGKTPLTSREVVNIRVIGLVSEDDDGQ